MKKKLFISVILVAFGVCFYGACNRLREDVNPVLDNGDIAKDSSSYIYSDTAR